MSEDNDNEQGWLPIIERGCTRFSPSDREDLQMVTFDEGEFHLENDSLEMVLRGWIDSDLPVLDSDEFHGRRG